MPTEPLLDPHEVADILNVSVSTVRKLRRDGELRGIRVAALLRFERSEVDRYVEAQRLGVEK